jgi:hypothetical protein
MADEKKNLEKFNKKRISCLFIKDFEQYNAGESAVFDAQVAHAYKKRGAVEFNEHEVQNDSNLMGLLSGQNSGGFGVPEPMSDEKVSALIDKLLDEKLKPLFELLDKSDKDKVKPEDKEPLKGAVKK